MSAAPSRRRRRPCPARHPRARRRRPGRPPAADRAAARRLRDPRHRGPLADARRGRSAIATGSRPTGGMSRSMSSCRPPTSTPSSILTSGSHGRPSWPASITGSRSSPRSRSRSPCAEADAIAARLAADPSARLQVGYMKLYDPAVVRARAVAADAVPRPAPRDRGRRSSTRPPSRSSPTPACCHRRATSPAAIRAALRAETDAAPARRPRRRGGRGARPAVLRHPARQHRPRAGPGPGLRRRSGRDRRRRRLAGRRWPPSVELTGRLPDDGRVSIRWHFLPDYPAYREEVRVVYERRRSSCRSRRPTCSIARPSCALSRRRGRAAGATTTSGPSTDRGLRGGAARLPCLVVDGAGRRPGLREGRADIVTCQRIVAGARRAARPADRRAEAAGVTEPRRRPPRPAHALGPRVVRAVPGLPDAAGRADRRAARADGGRRRGCASRSTARPRRSTTTSRSGPRPSRSSGGSSPRAAWRSARGRS